VKDREEQASFDQAAIEQWWIEEVERRIASIDAGFEELIPGEKVLEELRNRNR
jgi:hypothetical protein